MAEESEKEGSVLGPFKAHLWDYRRLVFWLLGLGTIPPIVGAIGKIGPPWPDVAGIGVYTSLFLWLVLLTTYQRWQGESDDRLKQLNGRLFITTLCLAVVYLGLSGSFVVDAPDANNRIAIGFWLLPEQQEILEKGKFPDGEIMPVSSEEDLLRGNEWKPKRIYPAWTVDLMRILLLGSWVCGFGSLAALSSVFILSEGNRKAARDAIAKQQGSSTTN